MPILPPTTLSTILSQLVATGSIGMGTPKLASGVTAGLLLWLPQLSGTAITVGTLGVGVATAPLIVPAPALFGALAGAFVSTGIVGVMSPLLAAGLATGLSLTFAQGVVLAPTPTTGVGGGVIKFVPVSAVPSMIQGFASVGMVLPDSIKTATAIGIALTLTFTALILPAVVVGTPSILPSVGVGVAKVV